MKLWVKIFLCSLALVVIAINITALVTLSESTRLEIEREQDKAMYQHRFFSSVLSNNVVYQRLKTGDGMLNHQQTEEIVSDLIEKNTEFTGVAVFRDENLLNGSNEDIAKNADVLKEIKSNSENYVKKITDINSSTAIVVGSQIVLEGTKYVVITASDITDIYLQFDQQTRFVCIASFVFAIVIAVVLLGVVKILLKPLNIINKGINDIAGGNYTLRLNEKGGYEFRTLSSNINIMTESIEENFNKIQAISDGRKQFIDDLSHEMKTPLTSILGFADILRIKRTMTDEERIEYSQIIFAETKRLQALSGKLMEIVTTGTAQLDFSDIESEELFDEIRSSFKTIFANKNITLVCNIVPCKLYIDKELCKSMIYNILDNAVKASESGSSIELGTQLHNDNYVISIKDYGIGINKDELSKIMEPFYMVDKARSRQNGGAGLGLALCSKIIMCHNGTIKIDSKKGQGTEVTITLPLKRGEVQ